MTAKLPYDAYLYLHPNTNEKDSNNITKLFNSLRKAFIFNPDANTAELIYSEGSIFVEMPEKEQDNLCIISVSGKGYNIVKNVMDINDNNFIQVNTNGKN